MRKKLYSKAGPGGGGQKRRRRRRQPAGASSRGGGVAAASLADLTSGELTSGDLREVPAEAVVPDASLDFDHLHHSFYALAKRGFDIAASVVALAIFGLMLPLLTLIIKLDSPGPVFYSQERVGLNRRRSRERYGGEDRRKVLPPGRPCKVFKLRSLTVNAGANRPQLANANDGRVTRVIVNLVPHRDRKKPAFVGVSNCVDGHNRALVFEPPPIRRISILGAPVSFPLYR